MQRPFVLVLVAFAFAMNSGCEKPPSEPVYDGKPPSEPVYDGKPAGYWKAEMRKWTAQQPGAKLPPVLEGGEEAVPVLIELVKEVDLWVRVLAIRSLARIGPAARDAVPVLITALEDHRIVDSFDVPGGEGFGMDWALLPVYREAAEALGAIGPAAQAAVPALRKVRPTDRRDYTTSTIDAALKRINPQVRPPEE
jgi:hypothetical protein